MTTLRIPKCMAVILHDWKSNLFTQCGLRLVSRDALTPSCSLPSASFLVGEPRAHPMQPFSSSLLHTLTTGTTTWKRFKNEYAETIGKRFGNDLETTSIYSMIPHVSKAVPLLNVAIASVANSHSGDCTSTQREPFFFRLPSVFAH